MEFIINWLPLIIIIAIFMTFWIVAPYAVWRITNTTLKNKSGTTKKLRDFAGYFLIFILIADVIPDAAMFYVYSKKQVVENIMIFIFCAEFILALLTPAAISCAVRIISFDGSFFSWLEHLEQTEKQEKQI